MDAIGCTHMGSCQRLGAQSMTSNLSAGDAVESVTSGMVYAHDLHLVVAGSNPVQRIWVAVIL